MTDPISDPMPGERPGADRQPDLFHARGRADVGSSPGAPVRRAAPFPGSLSDAGLVGLLAGAGPSDDRHEDERRRAAPAGEGPADVEPAAGRRITVALRACKGQAASVDIRQE